MLSSLRLFKAVPVNAYDELAPFSVQAAQATIPRGFIFAPSVTAEYSAEALTRQVNTLYGRDAVELNAGFHKSFATVRDTSMAALWVQQALHYLSTYGRRDGLFKQDGVTVPYVPDETLDAPELKGARLVVIRALTKPDLKAELQEFLGAGVALSEQSVADAVDIAELVGFEDADLSRVKNREVRAALYDHLGLVPAQPDEFMRFLVFKATGRTQVVKNQALFAELKARSNEDLVAHFTQYEALFGVEGLASVYHRYKPVFLGLRTNVALRKYVNRISKLADEHHKPMPVDYLNTVTAQAKGPNRTLNPYLFRPALAKASFFRKARLAYALKFRASEADSIMYRIRNGKSFAKAFSNSATDREWASAALELTVESMSTDLARKVVGNKVYIPEGVKYGLPSSEKQFTGGIPSGTSVTVADNAVIGVHWDNVGGQTDLDLSLTSANGKIGWDRSYRDSRSAIYFSGDLTDAPAPDGASELFHIGGRARGSWLLNLNYYNFRPDVPVPFKILVGRDEQSNIERDRLIDPNKLIAYAPSQIDVKQKTLGLIIADDRSTRFFFTETGFGSGITARNTEASEWSRKFLYSTFTDPIVLNDLLVEAGAVLVDDPAEADIDLSLEAVDKSTFINLLA